MKKECLHYLEHCMLCPRKCGINRLNGMRGYCMIGKNVKVSAYNIHFGEEPPISGVSGSGTIFFAGCNLRCVFCQNYPISQLNNGNEISICNLSDIMIELQDRGAHNINFVTPTHVIPQIISAISGAREKGLNIPIVYNSGGYESVESLKLLEGMVDIYMPDIKYSDDNMAEKYSGAQGYWNIAKEAVKEMYRQVGTLKIQNGIAERGLLIRHLVLPDDIAGSKKVFEFLCEHISAKTYVSIMAQYHPANKSSLYPEIDRKIDAEEYEKVIEYADGLGLCNGWRQDF